MEAGRKVRLDLKGISLVRTVAPPGATVNQLPEIRDAPVIVTPRRDEGGFLVGAIQRKTMSFQERLASLPDAPNTQDYSQMPVEQFGDAALRGMRWRDGKNMADAGPKEAVQFVPLPEGVGLGYGAVNGEEKDRKGRPIFVKPGGRSIVGVSQTLERVEALKCGSPVWITDGSHSGLTGTITKLDGEGRVSVELDISGARIDLGRRDVAQPGTRPPKPHTPVLSDVTYPSGAVCRITSRTSYYHHRVRVVQTDPLIVCLDNGKILSDLSRSDLAPMPVSENDAVLCLKGEHFGKRGVCVHIENVHATVLFDDGCATMASVSELTLYKNC